MYVNTSKNDRLHSITDGGKVEFSALFFLHQRGYSSSFSHRIALIDTYPFCSAQIHISVFDELHFDHYQFYQSYMPTALMMDIPF